MGEVYRARDTRLDRTVAIKVLPGRFTGDPERRERLEREARIVSSLNHPHICVLYDIGEQEGIRFLVMELLQGESLAARLERGAMPPGEALRYAIEIAGALDAAHRLGVVHRDLKPGNIMLTKAGAKLLDFGLAKVRSAAAAADQTATMAITREGSIAGTLQYMPPEQLEGQKADARSDVFGFGAVLYEMLAGRRAFDGKSHASLIAAIMTSEPPPVCAAQPMAPKALDRALDRVVRRCLAKNAEDRWQSARDLRQELVWISEDSSTPETGAPVRRQSRQLLPWLGAAACAVVALGLAVLLMRQEKPVARPIRFAIPAPPGTTLGNHAAISPDGESIAFMASAGSQSHLYLTSLSTGLTRQLAGTEEAIDALWSFDSRSLLMYRGAGQPLLRMDLSGSLPQMLSLPFQPTDGQAWGPQGIVSGSTDHALYSFQPDGSGLRKLRDPAPEDAGGNRYPSLIPGGRWLIYNGLKPSRGIAAPVTVHVSSMDGSRDRMLFATDSGYVFYAPPGYLLYRQGSALTARPIDPRASELRGEAKTVVEGVGNFSTSDNGDLAYLPDTAAADSQLIWFDRSGTNLGISAGPAEYTNPALSPDGKRVAVGIRDPMTKTRDIWIFDLSRGSKSKLTFDPKDDLNPTWSPDGSRIAFSSDRRGHRDLYVKSASGSGEEELLLESKSDKNLEAWSPDGRSLTFNEGVTELWTWSFDTRQAQPFVQGKRSAYNGSFSPDSRWIAYMSFESGRGEVYVRPSASSSGSRGQWLISNGGGNQPQWRGDGKELFYTSSSRQMMAVDIDEKDGAIVHGTPHVLFQANIAAGVGRSRWVVSRDGKRFLVVVPVANEPATRIEVILNWPSLLAMH
jgi:serine/threonine protein kinase